MPTSSSAAAAAAAEAARQRAIAEAKRRAEEAARKAQEEAAKKAAAKQAAAAAAKQKTVNAGSTRAAKFGREEFSTGKGGALRRDAVSKLGAQGLNVKSPDAADRVTKTPQQVAQQDATALSGISDPAAKAQALDNYISTNKDPAYRAALVTAAKPQIEQLENSIVNKDSGASKESRQAALNSLTHATEQFDETSQKAITSTFAAKMKNQNVGDDDDEFGTMLKNSIKAGNGASFGVRLASELQATGKETAANDSSKFVGQAIKDIRKDFDKANDKVSTINQHLAQEVPQWEFSGTDKQKALATFSKNNDVKGANAELDKQAKLLASVEAGSGIAATDPTLKAGAAEKQVMGRAGVRNTHQNEVDLLSASTDALKDVSTLATTDAGAKAITDALKASGSGQPSFIDQARETLSTLDDAKGALESLQSAVLQASGVRLLKAAQSGGFQAEQSAILAGLRNNSKLFGTNQAQLDDLTSTLGKFKPGMTQDEINAITREAGSKIDGLSDTGGKLKDSLKGFSLVLGAVSAVDDWKNFDQASVKDKIATITSTLQLGSDGADLAASTFSRFTSSAAAETGEVAAETGLAASKLFGAGLGALGTVVSGWNAFDDFKNGDVQKGIGDTMGAIGGAVATAGLFLDGSIAGAPAGVVLNIAGGVIAGVGALVSLFASEPDPFEGQQDDLGKILEGIGVKHDVAEKLKDFNGDGQNFGTWVSSVAKEMNMSTGDFVRSMNNWSGQQVTDFLDAGRLQHDTDGNNYNRLQNASHVLGDDTAKQLEDWRPTYGGRYVPPPSAHVESKDDHDAKKDALRVDVDKDTGKLTYKPDMIKKAAEWIRNGRST